MITIDQFEARLRRTSQLRAAALELRYGLLDAYRRGESPIKPRIDIRSDYEYWKNLADEKRVRGK